MTIILLLSRDQVMVEGNSGACGWGVDGWGNQRNKGAPLENERELPIYPERETPLSRAAFVSLLPRVFGLHEALSTRILACIVCLHPILLCPAPVRSPGVMSQRRRKRFCCNPPTEP
jgi:hypothetical protein